MMNHSCLLLPLLLSCCASLPELPEVRETAPSTADPAFSGEPKCETFGVGDIVKAVLAEHEDSDSGQEQSDETPERILGSMASLLQAAAGGDSRPSIDFSKMEVVLDAAPGGLARARAALEGVRSRPKARMSIETSASEVDPDSFASWDVLFRPVSELQDGEGMGVWALVPSADLSAWALAATRASSAKRVSFPKIDVWPLQQADMGASCQVAFVSHMIRTEKDGAPSIEPVMASLSHGLSMRLRALPLRDPPAVALRFEIDLRKPPHGRRLEVLPTKKGMIHVPNFLERSVSGTVVIPEGASLVLVFGFVGCWGSDTKPGGEGWLMLVKIKPLA